MRTEHVPTWIDADESRIDLLMTFPAGQRRPQQVAIEQLALASRSRGLHQALSKLLQNLVNSALLGLRCWLLLHDQLNGGGGMLIVAGACEA